MTTFRTARILTSAYMLLAVGLSFTHIAELFTVLGSTWQAWLAPLLIDGLWLLGQLGRSAKFTPSTRKAGGRLVLAAGSVSLACNVLAGNSVGDRLIGAIVLVGFAACEWYSAKLRPVTRRGSRKARPAAPAAAAKPTVDRAAAARKAAVTRQANAARKALAPAAPLTHPDVKALDEPVGTAAAYL